MSLFGTVRRDGNVISVVGNHGMGEFHKLIGTIYDATNKRGYQDIVLDFSKCEATFNGPMLSVCAQVQELKKCGVSIELVLPVKDSLAKLFINTNWASIIDPSKYNSSTRIRKPPLGTLPVEGFRALFADPGPRGWF